MSFKFKIQGCFRNEFISVILLEVSVLQPETTFFKTNSPELKNFAILIKDPNNFNV
jgi:hypothetical protein